MRRIAIVCMNYNNAIGINNDLIFDIPSEMNLFKKHTKSLGNKQNIVLMGRKTFQSIGCKPLPKRHNIVITSNNLEYTSMYRYPNLVFKNDIELALKSIDEQEYNDLYVCGGEGIYKYFIENNLLDLLYVSTINNPKYDVGNVFFPDYRQLYGKNIQKIYSEDFLDQYATYNLNGENVKVDYNFSIYYNMLSTNLNSLVKNTILNDLPYYNNKETKHPETEYLDILNNVLQWGSPRQSRNALTISKFGKTMEFDISSKFPLLTTKKVFWKGVLHELLWFLKGDTNSKHLSDKGVRIWDGNTTREYLDSINLKNYSEGECGPIYGYQWRHFNAKYRGCESDYSESGVDQLQNIINLIKNDPTSRRMFMSAWNPEQLKEMCLPPCHVSYQFYVRTNPSTHQKHLSCSMYQRSGDLFLGVPFNIASTSALTYILAKLTNCKPDRIIINIGDAHIYKDHIDAVQEQLKRKPYEFPTLTINGEHNKLEDFKFEDFVINDYVSHPTIKAKMIA